MDDHLKCIRGPQVDGSGSDGVISASALVVGLREDHAGDHYELTKCKAMGRFRLVVDNIDGSAEWNN
jgi:hypothetical protein